MSLFRRLVGADSDSWASSAVAESREIATRVKAEAQHLNNSAALKAWMDSHSALTPFEITAVQRCVYLLAAGLAMLPVRVVNSQTRAMKTDHRVADLLRYEPNTYQTAFEFKFLMELRRITEGNAYAVIAKAGGKPVGLHPVKGSAVNVRQNSDWSLTYTLTRNGGEREEYPGDEILHLRDYANDVLVGQSRLKLAKRAIATTQAAENAQRNIFETGALAKGMLSVEGNLSDQSFERLKADMKDFHGPDSASRILLGEQNMKYSDFGMSGRDAQAHESRAHQIEEIGRVFGVPRPLLMMDDTSWGSGIEQLATLFVRFGLAPSLVCWEQSTRRSLLTRAEKRHLDIDIDERLLLRGSLKDQAEYYAKGSGSGGHRPWLHPDEIRHATGEPPLSPEQKSDLEASHGTTAPA